MNIERLRRLEAEHRKPLPKGVAFNMNTWGRQYDGPQFDPCRFAFCAGGLASTIPEFQEEGLANKIYEIYEDDSRLVITYQNKTNLEALQEFFGLTEHETNWLFSPSYYEVADITKEEVADRIEELISYGF